MTRTFQLVLASISIVTINGCGSLEISNSAETYRSKTIKDSYAIAEQLQTQAQANEIGNTYWLKPKGDLDCDYTDKLKTFSEIKISEIMITPAQTGFHKTFQLYVSVDTKSLKGAYVKFVTDSSAWGNQVFDQCFYKFNPKKKYTMSEKDWNLISMRKYRIGFTKDQILLSIGEPERINRTVSEYGADEQWVYLSGKYIYFKNDKLIAVQN